MPSAMYYILGRIRVQLIVFFFMFLMAAFMFMWYQGLDFLTAMLASFSTITTIGLYAPSIAEIRGIEQPLLIMAIEGSLLSVVSAIYVALRAIVDGRRLERRTSSQIKEAREESK